MKLIHREDHTLYLMDKYAIAWSIEAYDEWEVRFSRINPIWRTFARLRCTMRKRWVDIALHIIRRRP